MLGNCGSAASALNSLRMNSAALAGPAVGGIVISIWGVGAAYLFDLVTFVIAIAVFLRLPSVRAGTEHVGSSVRHVWSGVRYAWSRKDILGSYTIDFAAMTFAFPFALFPFIAQEYGAPWALGLLYSAGFAGGPAARRDLGKSPAATLPVTRYEILYPLPPSCRRSRTERAMIQQAHANRFLRL